VAPRTTLPPARVLDEAPSICVARVALGVTIYIADPVPWATGAASLALGHFLRTCPSAELRWWTTSHLESWRAIRDPNEIATLRGALASRTIGPPLRHLFRFDIGDRIDSPAAGFSYRECDPDRSRRMSVLQVCLPDDTAPEHLGELLVRLTTAGPIWCAIGGYAASWFELEKPTAFADLYGWCRRYLGLDVQDPEQASWRVHEGLPSTNWLTYLGPDFLRSREIDAAAMRKAAAPPVTISDAAGGLFVKAGPAPALGDVNRAEFPSALAQAAVLLDRCLIEEPPEFWGTFYEKKATKAWQRRFVAPDGWS